MSPAGLGTSLIAGLVTDPPDFTEERRKIKAAGQSRTLTTSGLFYWWSGFGCLEVVLDKWQEDDWFGSPFITTVTIVSLVSLA